METEDRRSNETEDHRKRMPQDQRIQHIINNALLDHFSLLSLTKLALRVSYPQQKRRHWFLYFQCRMVLLLDQQLFSGKLKIVCHQ